MSDCKIIKDVKICPKCGNHYIGFPALSRVDNKTKICPDCGTTEAMESIGYKIFEPLPNWQDPNYLDDPEWQEAYHKLSNEGSIKDAAF